MQDLKDRERLCPFCEVAGSFVDAPDAGDGEDHDNAAKDGEPEESADGVVGREVFFRDIAFGEGRGWRPLLRHV